MPSAGPNIKFEVLSLCVAIGSWCAAPFPFVGGKFITMDHLYRRYFRLTSLNFLQALLLHPPLPHK